MNKNSRTKNSAMNIAINIFYQVTILLLSFLTRRVFIKNLGVDYLGISGLFSNVLELFSLAELGIAASISFSMYKYLAEKNVKKLVQLNSYYKTLYNRIAVTILVFGIALIPFLKFIINFENDIPNIEIYYLVCLLNSVFSYLFVYKTTIVGADQSEYRLKVVNILLEIAKAILQIFAIVILKNYLIYLLVQILITFTGNLIKSKLAEKWYPFIKEKAELPEEEKKDLWTNIKSMFFYKIGSSVMNHTDNILTSMIVSTTMVGIYSNYTMIYLKISSFIGLIFNSISASVGNLNAQSNGEELYRTFKILSMMSYILFMVACVGMWFVMEDAITAISGSTNLILEKPILIVTIVNYYCMGILNPNTIYRQTTGLFKVAKYSMLLCCILNIIFSIILGKIWGLFGIILASIIARLLTNIWYEPYILYTKFFEKNPLEHYSREFIRVLVLIGTIILMTPMIQLIAFSNLYMNILLKSILCLVIPAMILYIIYGRSEEVKFLMNKFQSVFHILQKKVKNNE